MFDCDHTTILNGAPPGALCYECSRTALTTCPWPVQRSNSKGAVHCDRPTCADHGFSVTDRFGRAWLPGICLEHRNMVMEARAHREEIMVRRQGRRLEALSEQGEDQP